MTDEIRNILCCDWGSSSFRMLLVDRRDMKVVGQVTNGEGIFKCFEKWKEKHKEKTRIEFYYKRISRAIQKIESELQCNLRNVPVVISGMASSNLGMREITYSPIPFQLDGSDLITQRILVKKKKQWEREIFLISGAENARDTMRGEETLVIGVNQGGHQKILYIIPGTHSKHIIGENQQVTDVKTYMTGEFFNLLASHSILKNSVDRDKTKGFGQFISAFCEGVKAGASTNILHAAFSVRVNQLFTKMDAFSNYYYLSGMLIGAELLDIFKTGISDIIVIADREKTILYRKAFDTLQEASTLSLRFEDASTALVRGQLKIYAAHKSH